MRINVEIDVQGDGGASVSPDISDAEMYAIGRMISSWALLENLITEVTFCLSDKYGVDIPNNFIHMPFAKRMKHFSCLVDGVQIEKRKVYLKGIISRINGIKSERDDFSHGIWDWSDMSPTHITVWHMRKKRKIIKKYNAEIMVELSRRIGRIAFDLMYPLGLKQYYRDVVRNMPSGGYISRKFMISLFGHKTTDPTLDLAEMLRRAGGNGLDQ